MDARRRLRMADIEDWSELPEEALLKKLIERKVISQYDGEEDIVEEVGAGFDGHQQSMKCSNGFLGVCRLFDMKGNCKPSKAQPR